MKSFIAAIMIGAFTVGSLSHAAAESKPTSDKIGTVGAVSARDATDERNSYLQQARDEMRSWEQKLHDFDAKVQIKATDAETKASKNLDDAWTDTNYASRRLEAAGAADWNKAKASFKTATAKLTVAWRKIDPAGK